MNLHDLIEQAAFAWITQEKANAQSLPGQIALHIDKAGKLRLPQREAIEIYLWLKFVGQNRSLAEIIRAGALRDDTDPHPALCKDATAEFLFRFAKANELTELAEMHKLEFYYNGYRNGSLQSLVIRTPYGTYTPDFLVLKRKPAHTPYRKQKDYAPDTIAGPIDRVLILETKGKKFYDADFQAKENSSKKFSANTTRISATAALWTRTTTTFPATSKK